MLDYVRRSRLHLVTGGHDAAEETPCAHCARGRHVGANARRCAQVRAYAYSSPNLSLCERLFLNAFWDGAVRRSCPTWIAPNLMTALGLLAIAVAYALIWRLSPNLAFEAPRWTYAACAALAFAYQTADGMDGKQARRTKSGSPLGEVVDHACDALSMCIYPLIVMDIFGVGHRSRDARAICTTMMMTGRAMFVVDTVSSTFTGVLPVSEFLDSQEIQLICQTLMLCVAFSGSNAFLYAPVTVPFVGATTLGRAGAVFCITTGAISRVGTFVNTVLKANKKEAPPHWPAYRKPLSIAARCALVEAFHGLCLYKAKNFAYAHATSSILFGESEARIMSIRVSDPDFPVTNWLALFIMALTTVVPEGDAFVSGMLMGAALFMLLHRGSCLAAQITGCLGMHPNIFIIRPRDA